MKTQQWILFPLIAVVSIGCQKYCRQPLSPQAIDRALSPPKHERLTIDARNLTHPMIQPVALDLRNGLNPDEAAVIGVLVNPSLRQERDRRLLGNAQVLQAGLFPNPEIKYSFEDPVGGLTEGTVNAVGWGLNWNLRELIAKNTNVYGAEASRSAIDLEILWKEWLVAESAKLATYKLANLGLKLEESQAILDRLTENLGVVREAEQKGFVTEQDLSAAESARFQSETLHLEIVREMRNQRIALNKALGLPPENDIPIETGIFFPSHLEVPSSELILADIETCRLDLVALRMGYESQEASVRTAILEQFPNFSIGLTRSRDTGDVITNGFGIGFDVPLFDRNQGDIAEESANRRILFDEYVTRIFETRSEVAVLTAEIDSLNEQIALTDSYIPTLTTLLEQYRLAVDQGQAEVLNYYSIWNDLASKRIALISQKEELKETQIALEIEAGTYHLNSSLSAMPENLSAPEEAIP